MFSSPVHPLIVIAAAAEFITHAASTFLAILSLLISLSTSERFACKDILGGCIGADDTVEKKGHIVHCSIRFRGLTFDQRLKLSILSLLHGSTRESQPFRCVTNRRVCFSFHVLILQGADLLLLSHHRSKETKRQTRNDHKLHISLLDTMAANLNDKFESLESVLAKHLPPDVLEQVNLSLRGPGSK